MKLAPAAVQVDTFSCSSQFFADFVSAAHKSPSPAPLPPTPARYPRGDCSSRPLTRTHGSGKTRSPATARSCGLTVGWVYSIMPHNFIVCRAVRRATWGEASARPSSPFIIHVRLHVSGVVAGLAYRHPGPRWGRHHRSFFSASLLGVSPAHMPMSAR